MTALAPFIKMDKFNRGLDIVATNDDKENEKEKEKEKDSCYA